MNLSKTQTSRSWVIYTLSDPRIPETVRYVGITHGTIRKRLGTHIFLARKGVLHTRTVHWIQFLLAGGVEPVLKVIDNGVGPGWEASERYWITWHRERGFGLTNHTSGGQGSLGHPCSLETRAKLRAAKLGRRLSPEHRAKIGAAGLGRKPGPETRAKLRVSKLGNNPSPETRAKISAANSGRKHSLEARVKMSAVQRGKRRSPETCAKMSEAIRKSWESRERVFSPAARAKMSEAGKARWEKIRQIDLEISHGG